MGYAGPFPLGSLQPAPTAPSCTRGPEIAQREVATKMETRPQAVTRPTQVARRAHQREQRQERNALRSRREIPEINFRKHPRRPRHQSMPKHSPTTSRHNHLPCRHHAHIPSPTAHPHMAATAACGMRHASFCRPASIQLLRSQHDDERADIRFTGAAACSRASPGSRSTHSRSAPSSHRR